MSSGSAVKCSLCGQPTPCFDTPLMSPARESQPAAFPPPRFTDNGTRVVTFDTPWEEAPAGGGIFTRTGALVIERRRWMSDEDWAWFRDFILNAVNAPAPSAEERAVVEAAMAWTKFQITGKGATDGSVALVAACAALASARARKEGTT